MKEIDSLHEALERLYGRRTFGIKLGLDVERELLERMGNPHSGLSVIHVAGTNGKGSICAMLESVLRSAGIKTGLYTSPHLVRFNERIKIDGKSVSDEDLGPVMAEVEICSAEMDDEPTFFECATAMAFECFRRSDVGIAIVETGMGGRLDATNVVEPLMSIISEIGLEHQEYLGADIETIAAEKCGIIKKGRPVVCGATDEAAVDVIKSESARNGSSLIVAGDAVGVRAVSIGWDGTKVQVESEHESYGTMTLPLLGEYQCSNLATVISAVDVLRDVLGMNISVASVKKGVEYVEWPGRCQVLQERPTVILDGAHNPDAAKALAKTLAKLLQERPLGLVVGMCSDKDIEGFLRPFSGLVRRMWVVPIPNERNIEPDRLISAGKGFGWAVAQGELGTMLDEAEKWALAEAGVVCVTGSLFLAGEVIANRDS